MHPRGKLQRAGVAVRLQRRHLVRTQRLDDEQRHPIADALQTRERLLLHVDPDHLTGQEGRLIGSQRRQLHVV
ncbi:MAG: hypothetical protein P8Z81_16370 [Deinococcales bacterium]